MPWPRSACEPNPEQVALDMVTNTGKSMCVGADVVHLKRCVYLSHAKAIGALDRYLDYRIIRCPRTTGDSGRYRGLEPASKLILTRKGYSYSSN
jgi:hypothetical protein